MVLIAMAIIIGVGAMESIANCPLHLTISPWFLLLGMQQKNRDFPAFRPHLETK
jgi:hypothetical protein